ncbi:cupin domain-containing protein [Streptomyces sp. NPDC057199]|uniref:cupin domain-containing protein n=1 Tax=Streptomyces sp. NPDC057199 TaxID=3346047 RepID=UPI00363BEF80
MTTYFRPADEDTTTPYRAGAMGILRDDAVLKAGFWIANPADVPQAVEILLPIDRTVLMLKGVMTYEVMGGPTYVIRTGDSVSFPKGTTIRLTVQEPVRQFFVDYR